ncbi:MAG: hemerythrin family protein [Bacteroidales bacterium]|nr:hemerythrin family protein [Bacteroidales bacterium]
MEKLYWSDKLAFNNDKIDNQHKEIFELVNEMIETEKLFPKSEKFAEILSKLTDYGRYHFKTEEALMQSSTYPNFNEHFKEHQEYIYQVAMFNVNFKDGDYTEPAVVLTYVRN